MKNRLLPIFALMLVMCAFLFAGATTAYAADEPTETLSVDEVWLTGDTLHITVTDKDGGGSQTLELNLSDYAKPGDEYVTIQASDSGGRMSNSIQFRNPYYAPQVKTGADAISDDGGGQPTPNGETPEPAAHVNGNPVNATNPFTPNGTGTVVDNATDGDGKEFFTVESSDGNVFYLIVDRQRNSENVYLLNAVTEDDLASFAKPGDGKSVGAPVSPTPPTTTDQPASPEPTPPPVQTKSGGNTGTIIFIIIAIIAVGGAGYYFKIVKPKQQGADDDDDEGFDGEDYGEPDGDEQIDVEDDSEGGDEQ